MKLEDLLAMEVPGKQLRHICSKYDIKPDGKSIADYAKAIALDNKACGEGEVLAEEFQHAGKTAVRIFRPLDFVSNGIPKHISNMDNLIHFLKNKYGSKIVSEGIRIPPTDNPKLFKATEYKGKLYLSFTYLGMERRVFKNYEVIKERPQIVDYLVVHFDPFLLQMRVPTVKDTLFKEAFEDALELKTKIEWFNMSALSSVEAQELKCILDGGLTCAKHKMTEGIYDTIEVKAKPDIDLSNEADYNEIYSDKPFNSLTFRFTFRYNNGLEEGISIRITKDGINFTSVVSEEVIIHVINNMLFIKAAILEGMTSEISEAVGSS